MAKTKSRTREARQRRQKQRRQNKRALLLIFIVLVAVVAVAVIAVSSQPVEAHIPPDLQKRYEGISRSFSIDGYPQLGDLDAPITLTEYASFACPGCEVLHKDSFDVILGRVRTGQVLFTYVPMQTGSIPNAQGAARAALCAGRQGAFWEMHDVLFDWQTRYANTAYSQNRLLAGAETLGLNASSFTNCFNSAAITEVLNTALTEDVTGTPTVHVNGVTITAAQTGGIPSTEEILQAVDDATPDNWGMTDEQEPAVIAEDDSADSADAELDESPTVDGPAQQPTEVQPTALATIEQDTESSDADSADGSATSAPDDETIEASEDVDTAEETSDDGAESSGAGDG